MLKILFHLNAELVNNIFRLIFNYLSFHVKLNNRNKILPVSFLVIFPIHGCEIVDLDGNCIGKHYL